MLNATAKPASESSATPHSVPLAPAPGKEATPGILPPVAIGSPRIANRPPASTPEHAREKTGLARKLEMSFIDASIRNSPVRLDFSAIPSDAQDAGPATPSGSRGVDSPRKARKLNREYPSLKSRAISSPKAKPGSSRPAPGEIRTVKAAKTVKEATAQPQSPRHAPTSPRILLADAKSKFEDLVSPKARIRHLFEDVECITLTNSHLESQDGSFGRNRIAPDGPPRSPQSGIKRKADDEPEFRDKKRIRFEDDDVSKGSASASEDERHASDPEQKRKLEQLSTELRDWESETPSKAKPSAKTGISTNADVDGSYPFKAIGLAKAVQKARQKNQRWFTPVAHETASEALKVTLNGLRDANPGKIEVETSGFLQELFSLLPAGAIAGTEIFRKGLSRAIRELALTNAQWHRIETLLENFDQLDISKNPRGFREFRKMLNYIISKKNAMANPAPGNAES